jgi:DNA mismatch endonuclease (patch repair protein)
MKSPHKPRDPKIVSRLMRAVRSRDNRGELALRRTLSNLGLRFRLHLNWLPGRPDIVFVKARVAVFVDGDFWHARLFVEKGRSALNASLRTTRRGWWVKKLIRNAERDLLVTAALEGLGFAVVRLWEREILRDPEKGATQVARIVKRRGSTPNA